MQEVKRAVEGSPVCADLGDKNGKMTYGTITRSDKTKIYFIDAQNGEEVWAVRGEVFRTSKVKVERYKNGDANLDLNPHKHDTLDEQDSVKVPEDSEEVTFEQALAEDAELAKKTKKKAKKEEYVMPEHCPCCGIHLDNGYRDNIEDFAAAVAEKDKDDIATMVKMTTKQYNCMGCGQDFGPDFKPKTPTERLVNPDKNRYTIHKDELTASKRPAIDVDDEVASILRGMEPETAYEVVADYLAKMGVTEVGKGKKKFKPTAENFAERYAKLNPGMRRMNVGNILRNQMKNLGIDTLAEFR